MDDAETRLANRANLTSLESPNSGDGDAASLRLKRRILLPLLLAMGLLFAAFMGNTLWTEQQELQEKLAQDAHHVQAFLDSLLHQETEEMASAMQILVDRKPLREALICKDRAKLLELSEAWFNRLRQDTQITHLYFTGPDRINVLRVHQPDVHGDRIDRLTTLEAERSGQVASGLEIGWTGSLTLRTVLPWYDQNRQLVGFLEVGKEIDHVARELHRVLKVDVGFLVDKAKVDRALWEAGMRRLGREARWDRFPSLVLMDYLGEQTPSAGGAPDG